MKLVVDHEKNLEAFILHCEERGIRLNADKVKLRNKEVPVTGHVATGEVLRVDPSKVRAIIEMPPPRDVAAMQCLLGLVHITLASICLISQTPQTP